MDAPSKQIEFLGKLGSAINERNLDKLQTLITTCAKSLGAVACQSAAVACEAILENPTGWKLSDTQKAWLENSKTTYAKFAEEEAPAEAAVLSTLFEKAQADTKEKQTAPEPS